MNYEIDFYDPDFLDKLKDLHIVTKKLFQGRLRGKRRSLKCGLSLEFADYKKYSAGDDFRFVDWNILARLKKVMVKSFWDEVNINILIFIDTSKSMEFGYPQKNLYARKIAACIASVALENNDSVGICLFSDKIVSSLAPVHGRINLRKCFDILNSTTPEGKTDIFNSVRQFTKTIKDKGIVIIISDFYDSEGYKKTFAELINKGFEVNAIQLLGDYPDFIKTMRNICLEDSETGQRLHIDSFENKIVSAESEFCSGLKKYCLSNNIACFSTKTSYPFDKFVIDFFKYHITAG